jgi:type VI secretion system protein ImpH
MGTEGRRQDPPLERRLSALEEEPFRFEFVQAVRMLHSLAGERRSVGHDFAPSDEVVRFSVHRDLGFPASQIHDLSFVASDGVPPIMTVAFFGLTGPSGVLPTHYSELVMEEAALDGTAGPLAAFLDLFHHRLISLFYRAWERNHPHLSPDPVVRARFHGYLLAIIGECLGPTQGPHPEESRSQLRHAGLWAQKRRSAEALRILLEDRLNDPERPVGEPSNRIDVEIIPFVPRWIEVDHDRRLKLESTADGSVIGLGAILGSRVRDWQGQFRLRIGPLTARQFDQVQPSAPSREPRSAPSVFQDILELARRFVGPEFDFDLVLALRAEEVPLCRFDRGIHAPRLGLTWLVTRTPNHDLECIVRASRRRA